MRSVGGNGDKTDFLLPGDEIMFCKTCGAQIAENAKFCRNCGTPHSVAPAPAQLHQPITLTVCRYCGAQIAENAKFCDACGTQTSTEQANIQAQMMQTRQQNPPAYRKTATIITIILWVMFPGVGWLLSEGEPLFTGIMCGAAGAFTALAWITALIQHNKFMKNIDSHDINRKR